MNKLCAFCKTGKPFAEFSKDRQKSDGLSSYCRSCLSLKNKKSYIQRHGEPVKKDRSGLSRTDPAEYARLYRKENSQKVAAHRMVWAQKNRPKLREKGMRRYASQTRQTPEWLTKPYRVEMEGLYQFCQIFQEFQVDHIVPIRGKQVSGLHVPWNLQVLTRSENVSKSNLFNPSAYPQQGKCAFMES